LFALTPQGEPHIPACLMKEEDIRTGELPSG
jgi:hypothetical protein